MTDFTAEERVKIQALRPVLRVHQREDVYQVVLVALPQAFIGLLDRSFLLITRPALNLLDSRELQAAAAHEVGHEYNWAKYAAAFEAKDNDTLHRLELSQSCLVRRLSGPAWRV